MADRSLTYRLKADVTGFRAQMAQASASMKDFGDRATAGTKEGDKFRKGLTSVGNAAGAVAVATGAGLGAAVMAAAKFDESMSAVQAATHETAGNMDRLREAALQAGQDTAYSADEAALAIEDLAKAGVSTKDILGGGLKGALSLAAAGNMEVNAAAEAAARALTTFNLEGTQTGHVADVLAAGAGKAQGEVHDLSEALKQAGLVAAQSNFSIEETTGVLSAFASAGLMGSDAGTSLKTFMLNLVPSTKAAFSALEAYNLASFDAKNASAILAEQGLKPIGQGYEGAYKAIEAYMLRQGIAEKGTAALADATEDYMIKHGLMRTGFTKSNGEFKDFAGIAGELQEKLSDLAAPERQAALKKIFGTDAVRAANVLYKEGADGIQKWTDKVDDAGYAAETAAIRQDNLRGDIEKLGGAIQTALIDTGNGSQGPLRSLVQSLEDVVNAYNDLSDAAKGGVGEMLAYTTAIGGTIFVGSRIVTGIANTREAMRDLGLITRSTGDAGEATGKKMSRAMAAARIGAGLAGGALLLLSDDIREADAAAGTMAAVGGGALMGFAAAGPIGLAIGAGAGLLYDLEQANNAARESFKKSIRYQQDYKNTLDQTNAAITQQTRNTAYQNLLNNDALMVSRQIGISDRDMVGAALGREAALKRVKARVDELTSSNMKEAASGKFFFNEEYADDFIGSLYNMGEVLDEDQQSLLRMIQATETWRKALKGIPKGAFDELENLDFKPTIEQVKRLQKQFDLTPKEVVTIFEATGLKPTATDVASLQAQMKLTPKELVTVVKQSGAEVTEKQARDLLRRYDDLDKKKVETLVKALTTDAYRDLDRTDKKADDLDRNSPTVDVDADTRKANQKLSGLARYLQDLTSNAYNLRFTTSGPTGLGGLLGGGLPINSPRRIRRADGGAVYGPGTGTSDSIPAWLSNGEYVLKAAAVQKYGLDTLNKMNAMRFAGGGLVTRSPGYQASGGPSSLDLSDRSVARISGALLQARPLIGEANFHSEGDYERAKRDRLKVAGGGVVI